MLRRAVAGFTQGRPQICKVTFEGGNCTCRIDGDDVDQKIITAGSDVTIEVTPNDGYMFTKWSDENTDNPRTWNDVRDSFTAKAMVYEDFGPLCFTNMEGYPEYLTLRSRESSKKNTPVNEICPGLNLEYSTDGATWITYDMTKKPSENSITIPGGDKVYFRAVTSNPDGIGHDLYFSLASLSGGKANLTGSIMYLLDKNGRTRTIPENGFKGLFSPLEQLTTTVSPMGMPEIPVDNLGDNCCEDMFRGCWHLKVNETPSTGMIPWSINANGTIGSNWNRNMISGTYGTFTGDPENGTTYYIG